MSVRFWRSAGRFAASYIASHMRYIPCHPYIDIYRWSNDNESYYTIFKPSFYEPTHFKHSVIIMAARVMHFPSALVPVSDHSALFTMDKD